MKRKGIPKGPRIKFITVDLVVIAGSIALAFLIRFQELKPENLSIYQLLIGPIFLIRIGALFLFRLYDFSRWLTAFDVIYFTALAMLVSHGAEILLILYTRTFLKTGYQISRYILALNFLLSWWGAAAWRLLYLRRRRAWAYDRTRFLIVGAGELGESVKREIQQYSRLGHEVAGLVDDDIESRANGEPILGKLRDLDYLVEEHEIDEIIVTSRQANRQELLEIISACQRTGRKVRLLPELYEVTIGQVEIGQVAGIPLITVKSEPLDERGLFAKRALDVTVSLVSLLFLGLALPVIGLAIKSAGRGPVFFRQKRVGKDGRIFTLYKFRTMFENAELGTGPVLSWQQDPRVTYTGRWLRRWHLDELPQFINVLRGEMSLVGPRPERPHFAEQFERDIAAYRLRESVRPGMTGLAQIHGFYNSPVEHKLRYDLAYINNMSLLLDLKILFLTLRAAFTGHGNGV